MENKTYKVKTNRCYKSEEGRNIVESVHHDEAFEHTVWVDVAALSCVTRENGIVSIQFPARRLNNEQLEMVHELLPDLKERFFQLLAEQTMLEGMRIATKMTR